MVIVRGLCNKAAGTGDPHGPGMTSLWTGVDTEGQVGPTGPSIDQVIAQKLAAPTPHATIELRAPSPQDFPGKSIYNRMIYDPLGQPVDPRDDVALAVDALFLGLQATGPDGGADPRLALRKRVMSRLDGEIGRVEARLCNEDRQQLQALRDGLDTLSKSTGTRGPAALPACGPPHPSGAGDYPTIVQNTIDLLVMTLACDLTRVASLQLSQGLSPMVADFLGITTDHHSLSHQAPHRARLGPDAPAASDEDHPTPAQIAICEPAIDELTKINQFYATQIAYLCARLGAIPVGNGKTLLDQTVICWGNELDNGSDHDHYEIPYVLLGGAGGALETGQLVEYPVFDGYDLPESAKLGAKRATNDLYVTLAKLMGVDLPTFGNPAYNVGPLAELLA